jgi:hypothetical protein
MVLPLFHNKDYITYSILLLLLSGEKDQLSCDTSIGIQVSSYRLFIDRN